MEFSKMKYDKMIKKKNNYMIEHPKSNQEKFYGQNMIKSTYLMNDIETINRKAPIKGIYGVDLDLKYEDESNKSANSNTVDKDINTTPGMSQELRK